MPAKMGSWKRNRQHTFSQPRATAQLSSAVMTKKQPRLKLILLVLNCNRGIVCEIDPSS